MRVLHGQLYSALARIVWANSVTRGKRLRVLKAFEFSRESVTRQFDNLTGPEHATHIAKFKLGENPSARALRALVTSTPFLPAAPITDTLLVPLIRSYTAEALRVGEAHYG